MQDPTTQSHHEQRLLEHFTRRRLLQASAALTGIGLLTACGGGQTAPAASASSHTSSAAAKPTSAAASGSPAPAKITWLMRSSPKENKWERQTVTSFQKENTSITVELIIVPYAQVDPKLTTMVAAGTPPDIFSEFGASGFADYFARGLLLDLTPYFTADKFDLNRFLPGIIDIYKRNGRLYHMPQVTNFGVMTVYNKDLFQAAGLKDLPTSWSDTSWTWDTMVTYATKLTKNYGQGTNAQYGVNVGWLQNLWGLAYLWKDDPFLQKEYTTGIAPTTQLDHPGVIASAQAAADLVYKYKVAPTPADVQTMGAVGDIFSTGKIGIEFNVPTIAYQNFQDAPFKWGLAPIPRQKANKVSLYNGCWFVERQTKQPQAAWKFVSYLVSDPIATQMGAIAGFLVPLKSQLDPWIKQFVAKTGM
ncbi:MAG: sugar ABC transporter substrate-binding protein, partial [Chloroflexi bacterium]|nr:sugar ABC transporter substrate-binding protein [Chloroflexota bacterium]